MNPLGYRLDETFTEGLVSLVESVKKEKISVPYNSDYSGSLTINFKDGMIEISSTPVIKTAKVTNVHKISSKSKKPAPGRQQHTLDERFQMIKKEWGDKEFSKADIAESFGTSPDYVGQLLTHMCEKQWVSKTGTLDHHKQLYKIAV